MKKLMILSIFAASLIAACATPQQSAQITTAGRISGCSPDEIVVQDLKIPFGSNNASWTAICKGEKYFCSGYNTGKAAFTDVNCQKK